MTRRGLQIALQRDSSLPTFTSQDEAERELFQLRDDFRAEILQLAAQGEVHLDFSPESLKALERWYFSLRETDGFEELGVTKEQFERCIGFYTCHVYTENNPNFRWIVIESPLIRGKFDIAVTKDLMTVAVSHHSRSLDLKNNKRMESNYREYKNSQDNSGRITKRPPRSRGPRGIWDQSRSPRPGELGLYARFGRLP